MNALDIIGGTLLFSGLLWLSVIDWRQQRLPDAGTLSLLVLGLAWSYLRTPDLPAHLIGASAGYLAFAFIQWTYRTLRGREGLGGGDAKLLAAGGAWCAWQGLGPIVLIASSAALIVAVPLLLQKKDLQARIAFGPFLALGILLTWSSQRASLI
jgi:prepilin signal peptidase PulO-like enzyme (type II secretory pathway)